MLWYQATTTTSLKGRFLAIDSNANGESVLNEKVDKHAILVLLKLGSGITWYA